MIESAVQLEAVSGTEVELRLDRQGVGGYLWTLAPLPDGLRENGPSEQQPTAGVGGGAVLIERLVGDAPGTFRIVCELKRPWGDHAVAERRIVTLVIKPRAVP